MVRENHLIIRADGGPDIGMGHIMRCMALAQAWQDNGGEVIFLTASGSKDLENLFQSFRMKHQGIFAIPGTSEEALHTADVGRQNNASWVVVDGYGFGARYQSIIKDSGLRLLFVDDNGHAAHYFADIVLNQNIYANETYYKNREPYTKLLLGTGWALLRREFLGWRNYRREFPEVARKILVTFGGGDSDDLITDVIKALGRFEDSKLELFVALGAGKAHPDELKLRVQASQHTICLRRNLRSMAERMAWADVAISAAGSTLWELAFMGLPTCIMVVAENQILNARVLHEKGIAMNMGSSDNYSQGEVVQVVGSLIRDRDRRKEMSSLGRSLVNGLGANRIISMMSQD